MLQFFVISLVVGLAMFAFYFRHIGRGITWRSVGWAFVASVVMIGLLALMDALGLRR